MHGRQQEQCQPTRARTRKPTGAARRGSPPCRRSTRWTSPAPASTTSSPSSRAIGSATRSRATISAGGSRVLPRRRRPAWCAIRRKLDPLIDDALSKGWPLKRIDAILRAVLRAGSYELEHRKDVPGRVVVSEYVDVAHAFVEGEETGMVNAVLDQIARQFRADEFAAWLAPGRIRRGLADRALFQADRDRPRRASISTTMPPS